MMTYSEAIKHIQRHIEHHNLAEPHKPHYYINEALNMAIRVLAEKAALEKESQDSIMEQTVTTVTIPLVPLDKVSKSGYIYPSNLYEDLSDPDKQCSRFIFTVDAEAEAIIHRDITKTIGYIKSIDTETNSAQVVLWGTTLNDIDAADECLMPVGAGELVATEDKNVHKIINFECYGFVLS